MSVITWSPRNLTATWRSYHISCQLTNLCSHAKDTSSLQKSVVSQVWLRRGGITAQHQRQTQQGETTTQHARPHVRLSERSDQTAKSSALFLNSPTTVPDDWQRPGCRANPERRGVTRRWFLLFVLMRRFCYECWLYNDEDNETI